MDQLDRITVDFDSLLKMLHWFYLLTHWPIRILALATVTLSRVCWIVLPIVLHHHNLFRLHFELPTENLLSLISNGSNCSNQVERWAKSSISRWILLAPRSTCCSMIHRTAPVSDEIAWQTVETHTSLRLYHPTSSSKSSSSFQRSHHRLLYHQVSP